MFSSANRHAAGPRCNQQLNTEGTGTESEHTYVQEWSHVHKGAQITNSLLVYYVHKTSKKKKKKAQWTNVVELQYKPFNECTQPPQEQPGVMSLRTQSTDIFTQLCSLPSMTMSQDVSNVLQWGEKGRMCVCVYVYVCVFWNWGCCMVHAYLCSQQTSQ